MKSKNNILDKDLKRSSKEKIFAKPLSQKQLIQKINSHTRFTRQFTQLLITQSDTMICRSEMEKHGR